MNAQVSESRTHKGEATKVIQKKICLLGGGNLSKAAEAVNMSRMVRKGHRTLANIHLNECTRRRNNRALQLGTIEVFVNLMPMARGVENWMKHARVSSIPFDLVRYMDM